jgi:hypothetical protein
VFNARLMMLVRALTMESPVITVYRMAPNAAAAMVPIAYANATLYTPSIHPLYVLGPLSTHHYM